ncbi:type VII secretion protein EccB [Nocardia sp. NPDC050793]|uniref:type VII secretion protein EccB n=1 Tax=Nocardia sp. NPDC050793 TaxID=3155159 RepID=UPI0033D760D9
MARFRVVTKHQISGWRFLQRRIEHALVRRDVSMRDDPQQGRSTALMIGLALACVGVVGAAVLAFFKPAKLVGNARIVSEKDSGALYVRLGGRLHPALNLTSARLIVGAAENPVRVSREELAKYPRGPWVGIPGAPGQIVDSGDRDSSWTVCDQAKPGAPLDPATGLPSAALSPVRTTVIGGPLVVDGATVGELTGAAARLLRDDTTTWLVYRDSERGVVRASVSLGNSAVTMALGIDSTAPVLAVSKGFINAIPEAPPLRVPDVPGAGEPVTLASGPEVAVGSVLTVPAIDIDRGAAYYLVSRSGVVRISSVVAAMVRNASSQGTVSARTVGPDVIAANLRSGTWPGTASFPTDPIRLVDPVRIGVTCYRWARGSGDSASATVLLAGSRLPLPETALTQTVSLVTAPASRGATADAVYLPRNTGRFVQVTGTEPDSPRRESLFWISDSGVRYGIDANPAERSDPTLTALNLRNPVVAPWSIVSLFAVGPTLSQRDARIQHDGIPVNGSARGLDGTP